MTHSRLHRAFVLPLVFLAVVAIGSPVASASSATNRLNAFHAVSNGPVLSGAACTGVTPGTIVVTGRGFTPGGDVDVVLHDQSGATPRSWSSNASRAVYGANGSVDPARGFIQGGALSAAVAEECAETVIIQAYDRETGTWSNWLSATPGCEAARRTDER